VQSQYFDCPEPVHQFGLPNTSPPHVSELEVAVLIVTTAPDTVQFIEPPVSVPLCCVAMHMGVVYVFPIVNVQVVPDDMVHLPPVAFAPVCSKLPT
jgi:hypothetical protein